MCTSPRIIKVETYEGTRTIKVPCGKCPECLKTKQNDYMVRIYEELMQCKKACFVTLTYSNATVPYLFRNGKRFNVVWKDDVKDWIKRYRTNYERQTGVKGIRYFLCSEYGPKTHRPHYHAIFFGLSRKDLKLALDDWRRRYGYVLAKDIDFSPKSLQCSARYVSKYALKGIFEDPFCCASFLASKFPAIQQRAWSNVYHSNEIIPFIFLLSNEFYEERIGTFAELERVFPFEILAKELQFGIPRRGVKTQACQSR